LAAIAAAPTLGLALAALVLMGAASTSFTATTNSLLQLAAPSAMRGRVMALWSVVYLGSTALGGPIVGWVSEHAGPRAGLALGALAAFATGACLLMVAPGEAAPRATPPPGGLTSRPLCRS
jgi:MFS family permease